MASKHTHQCKMLAQVSEFGVNHADRFPQAQVVGQLFATVAKSVEELSEHVTTAAARAGAARRDVPKKAVARTALRARMGTVSRTARALAVDRPGLDDQFRMPTGYGDQQLLTAARAFAREAAPLAADFVTHGLPKTFVTELEASIEAFATTTHDQAASHDDQVAERAAFEQALEAGLAAVERLDAIVPNYLGDDPAIAALWERARHVERGKRTKAVVANPAVSTPEAVTPPVTGA